MKTTDIISLLSAAVSFVGMLITIYFSKKALKSSNISIEYAGKANLISIGQTETALREQISYSRTRMEECVFKIQDFLKGRKKEALNEQEERHLEFIESTWRSSVENYLNSYEDACGKYLDEKTDKVRFKKAYVNEIKNICDPSRPSYSRLMHPSSTSCYEAIWKVYNEWHRYEK